VRPRFRCATAGQAPPPCTVTAFWLKYQDPDRCSRRVTQPPHIAGPLGFKLSRPEICLQKPIDMYNNLLQRIGVKNEK